MQYNEGQIPPQQQAQHIISLLQQAQDECRTDINQTSDPRARALFETVAETLGGAMKALHDYQRGTEPAWRPASQSALSGDIHSPTVSDLRVDPDAAEPPPRLTQDIPHSPQKNPMRPRTQRGPTHE